LTENHCILSFYAVAIAGYFINYVTEVRPNTSSALGAQFLAIAQGCFAVGRFSGAGIMKFVRPRIVFLIYLTGVIAFNAASIRTTGNAGLAMLSMTLFFESVCFPTIVALGIRGIGKHTKRGAGWIVGGVVGGACVPPLLAVAADKHNSTAFAMIVPVIFFIAAYSYALAVNFVPSYRNPADMIGEEVGTGEIKVAEIAAERHAEEGVIDEKESIEKKEVA
jgi:MFS transporter, FHS family, L-fucose permease